METGKLSRCTEQNSGWCHSYTHLVLGYTSQWKTTKTRGTDIKAVAEEKLLTEMCQSSLLSFIPNPNLAPKKSQMSQQAKKQLFPMFKLCRHRQRANTPTDLHPEQGIAALCTTLTSALPPLSVNSTSQHLSKHLGQRENLTPYLVTCREQGQAQQSSLSTGANPLIFLCSQILLLSGLTRR